MITYSTIPVETPQPQPTVCVPVAETVTMFGFAIPLLIILARIDTAMKYVKMGIRAIKSAHPPITKDARFLFVENLVDFIDVVLPGDSSAIKTDEVIDHLTKHPEVLAELVAETDVNAVKGKLLKLAETVN